MLLQCGPFTVHYENGFLRHIKHGNNEVLRMIYFALRDENWGTYPIDIEDEKISQDKRKFSIQYTAVNRRDAKDIFRWRVEIEGDEQGTISMGIEGEAQAALKKNRAGFCVLHPLRNIFDQPVEITHPNGSHSSSAFPRFVDPENPFKEIQSIRWRFQGSWFELSFSGDIFETEDQRNWTDASFKTFCTPLRLPFPVELRQGDRVSQEVVFRPTDSLSYREHTDVIVIRRLDEPERYLPRIGVSVSLHQPFTIEQASLIRDLKLDHLRFDIRLSEPTWHSQLQNQIDALKKADTPLELVLHLGKNDATGPNQIAAQLRQHNIKVRQVMVFSHGKLTTDRSHIDRISEIREAFPDAIIGAGTDHNFTELNRHRFQSDDLDFVTYAIDPQEHATDNLTIIENLEAQTDTVRSAHNIYGASVHVSPVALKRRSNPYATDPAKMDIPQSEQYDARQNTPFCANWTLGSIKAILVGNAASGTYHQVAGPLGIIHEGKPMPVYHAIRIIQEVRVKKVLACESSHPLIVDALHFEDGRLLIWNYTDKAQAVTLPAGQQVTLDAFGHKLFTTN